ncbi:PREDICTED: 5'-nucleotidase-like isoform X2 [Amphimedon queenslandica]|uniref:5'-Nucleotidase C-terminal domain-containing protein n=1 Tax=Amphimedon queenslandica TaxID=400682 RepID=A0A1X7TQ58_AMPQE|nr:PREDICTED: 5'-nucleotidase-like isoform X2 [Amphimedon queenslandica]|eukprot:XP_003390086.2 PREDICTED: 5'-nucleotidase-like isoform X2 [Amphimedon queenslandica]
MGSRCSISANSGYCVKAGGRIVPIHTTSSANDNEKQTKGTLGSSSSVQSLSILHFNDVYNIEEREREPVGGASRFKTAFNSLQYKNPLVLFSGDALAPSNMSVVTEGRQMIPVLNSLRVNVALYGNHDFDFGVDHLLDITKETRFPWLLSNVQCINTKRQLANGKKYVIITWNNIKVGILGLVEWEWLETLPTISTEEVVYTDFIESAREYIPILKNNGCELIIALTHMRTPNDLKLFNEVPEIQLILGGHDHEYDYQFNDDDTKNRLFVKSGSDFREFSEINIKMTQPITIELVKHTVTKKYEQDKELQCIVERFSVQVSNGLEEKIGEIGCPLDGRFSSIRSRETNLGNLITDIMRHCTSSDLALLNSGTLRSDTLHEPGDFKLKDLMSILPMIDSLVVMEIRGHQLLLALENGVGGYPRLEGRFPQVSGLSFTFNSRAAPRSRIIRTSVLINGEMMREDQVYKLCTKSYIAGGKDGYSVFKDCNIIVDEESGITLTTLVRNYIISKYNNNNGLHSVSSCSLNCREFMAPGEINPIIEGRINIIN